MGLGIIDSLFSGFRSEDSSPETPFSFISEAHFRDDLGVEESGELFKSSVKMVEIEVFTFCNRRCWFCPNNFIDRHSSNEYMDEFLYEKIISDLKMLDYSETISFSRYNEPLADRIILERLSLAASQLPEATLHLNTNGDYLNLTFLKELYSSGLKSLNIQLYLPRSEERVDYSEDQARKQARDMIAKLDLPSSDGLYISGEYLEYLLTYEDMRISLYARNFSVTGNDRGGLLDLRDASGRVSPCLSPFYHLYIDFNGSVMPCCNLRSDAEAHSDYVVADLTEDAMNIVSAYTSKRLTSWRRSLIGFTTKPSPCDSCNFVTFQPTKVNRAVNKRLLKVLKEMGINV